MTVRLPPMPSLRELLKMYNLQASKQLSQNFLLDLRVTDRIVKHCGDITNKVIIEVGPGPGPLSRSLINAGARRLIAVEKDQRFFPALQMIGQAVDEDKEKRQKFNLVHGDILEVSELDLLREFGEDKTKGVIIVGNLPFGIATPLLIKWLRDISASQGIFSRLPDGQQRDVNMVLMFQKEVVDRIVAPTHSADYGRLSVVSQYHCDVKSLFTIKGKTFIPPPKVDAGVVMMKPKAQLPQPHLPMEDLEKFCRILFSARRKQVNNNLRALLSPDHIAMLLQNSGLGHSVLDLRPQNLTVEQIYQLAFSFATMRAKLNLEVIE
jgi:dimethyladenosine transferase 1